MIVEVAFGKSGCEPNKAFTAAFGMLLGILEILVTKFHEAVDVPIVADLCHQCLRVIYNMYTGEGRERKLIAAEKKNWMTILESLHAKIPHLKGVPTNALAYEVDMMKRGLPLIKDNSNALTNLMVKGFGSAARFFATGDPSQ